MKTSAKITLYSLLTLVILIYFYGYSNKPLINKDQLISQIMDYKMSDVINRCKKDFNYTDEDMIILEIEFKRYITLCAFSGPDESTGMYSKDVDNLWHSFILFTKDYSDFCYKYKGKFIHHVPETDFNITPEKIEKIRKDFLAFIKNYEETFKEEVHPIWFLDRC